MTARAKLSASPQEKYSTVCSVQQSSLLENQAELDKTDSLIVANSVAEVAVQSPRGVYHQVCLQDVVLKAMSSSSRAAMLLIHAGRQLQVWPSG